MIDRCKKKLWGNIYHGENFSPSQFRLWNIIIELLYDEFD